MADQSYDRYLYRNENDSEVVTEWFTDPGERPPPKISAYRRQMGFFCPAPETPLPTGPTGTLEQWELVRKLRDDEEL